MLVIGVTGGIGSGKTTVTDLFLHNHQIPVLDADIIARELVEPGQPAVADIVKHFGDQLLLPNGNLDRKLLRNLVFGNESHRQWLENLLHPRIRDTIKYCIGALSTPYCLMCMPLLLETNQQDLIDRLLVVDVPPNIQIERVKKRDKLTDDEVQRILNVQFSRDARLSYADDVIDNTMTVEQLTESVKSLHQQYLTLAGS
jgi:dephospho-CoA kinase